MGKSILRKNENVSNEIIFKINSDEMLNCYYLK